MAETPVLDRQIAPADYRAAYSGAVLYDEEPAGRMWMRGRDRANLLHRLSTNQIEQLRPGQGTQTVLTTPIGRIIDVLMVYALEDALLLVTSPEQGPPVFSHLRKNIFFNDQVTLEPIGRSHGQLLLAGPEAPAVLAALGVDVPLQSLGFGIRQVTLAGAEVLLAGALQLAGFGARLLVPREQLADVRAVLQTQGVQPLSEASFELLRVEAGYGAIGREHSQEYIPLETGLNDAISFTKGCYVGQEIIARMESRNRLAKRLCGLRVSADDELPAAPTRLLADGKDAGVLTSLVRSPRFGPIALAYVRTAYAETGTTVQLAGSEVTAEVVPLPFEAAS